MPLSQLIKSMGNEVPDKVMGVVNGLVYRDFITVLSQTEAKYIHLRCHPDFGYTGGWSVQLRDYLLSRGIDAKIVSCDKPIGEVTCDYLGVVGFASASLKDTRAACDYAFIIGLTSISKSLFANPKFVYGKSEGISWIEENGSFDLDIFTRFKFVPQARKSIPDIVSGLSKSLL